MGLEDCKGMFPLISSWRGTKVLKWRENEAKSQFKQTSFIASQHLELHAARQVANQCISSMQVLSARLCMWVYIYVQTYVCVQIHYTLNPSSCLSSKTVNSHWRIQLDICNVSDITVVFVPFCSLSFFLSLSLLPNATQTGLPSFCFKKLMKLSHGLQLVLWTWLWNQSRPWRCLHTACKQRVGSRDHVN